MRFALIALLGIFAGLIGIGQPEVVEAEEEPPPVQWTAQVTREAVTPTPTPEPTPVPTPTPAPTPVSTLVPTPIPELVSSYDIEVHLTYYVCVPSGFCPEGNKMANGEKLHEGAVACGSALGMGQRFLFEGREHVCEDTGLGGAYWVDFWFYNKEGEGGGKEWQIRNGMSGVVTLID